MKLKHLSGLSNTGIVYYFIYISEFPNCPIMDADAEPRTKRKKIQRQLDSFFNKPVDVGKRYCESQIII